MWNDIDTVDKKHILVQALKNERHKMVSKFLDSGEMIGKAANNDNSIEKPVKLVLNNALLGLNPHNKRPICYYH